MVKASGSSRVGATWCAKLDLRVHARETDERLDRTVQVAAHDPLDMPMPADDFGELGRVRETVGVHPRDPRQERRMVHENHGRPVGRLLEARREPAQSLGAEQAADLAGHERVERRRAAPGSLRRRTA